MASAGTSGSKILPYRYKRFARFSKRYAQSSAWFTRFFGKQWWQIVLWMLVFCFLLIASLLLYQFLPSAFQRLSWAGVGEWATSPFSTAIGAVGAATIAGIAVVATLRQNRREEANKTWWETFEWAAERAIPSQSGNKALPYGVSLSILSPLLDEDLGGHRKTKSEAKAWELRKKACESLIALLTDLKSESERESPADAEHRPQPARSENGLADQPASVEDTEAGASEAAQRPTAVTPATRVFNDQLRLRGGDLISVRNFIEAHPKSNQTERLSAVYWESLMVDRLSDLEDDENELQCVTDSAEIRAHLKRLGIGSTSAPDALITLGKKVLVVEVKSLRPTPSKHSKSLRQFMGRAHVIHRMAGVRSLLVVDVPIEAVPASIAGAIKSSSYMEIISGRPKVWDPQYIRRMIQELLRPEDAEAVGGQ